MEPEHNLLTSSPGGQFAVACIVMPSLLAAVCKRASSFVSCSWWSEGSGVQAGTSSGQTHEATGTVQPPDGHVFAENLQAICQGEPVPPTAVAVMRTNDGRNSCSKKQPYLAFLLPERGRYVWMRSWEAWGLRKCSLCGMFFFPIWSKLSDVSSKKFEN